MAVRGSQRGLPSRCQPIGNLFLPNELRNSWHLLVSCETAGTFWQSRDHESSPAGGLLRRLGAQKAEGDRSAAPHTQLTVICGAAESDCAPRARFGSAFTHVAGQRNPCRASAALASGRLRTVRNSGRKLLSKSCSTTSDATNGNCRLRSSIDIRPSAYQ